MSIYIVVCVNMNSVINGSFTYIQIYISLIMFFMLPLVGVAMLVSTRPASRCMVIVLSGRGKVCVSRHLSPLSISVMRTVLQTADIQDVVTIPWGVEM